MGHNIVSSIVLIFYSIACISLAVYGTYPAYYFGLAAIGVIDWSHP